MGKKVKTKFVKNAPEIQSEELPKKEFKSDEANLMGLSKKSKKIKKTKPLELDSKILNAVPVSESNTESGTVSIKKKKNKKAKKHEKSEARATDVEPEKAATTNGTKLEKSNDVDEGESKLAKKTKKHKNKNKGHAKNDKNQTGTSEQQNKRKAPEEEKEGIEEKPKKKHKKNMKNKFVQNQTNGTQPTENSNKKEKALEADRDVVTSESESDDDEEGADNQMDQVNESILKQHSSKTPEDDADSSADEENSEKKSDAKVEKEEKKEKRFPGPEHSIFIGNLPTTVKKSTMKSLFKQYGKILTIRFRTNDGVTLFKKKDRKEAKALNCYIRFETKPEAQAACAMNGQLVEGNRIRVTMHLQKQMGHASSTIFVGNINRKTTDNELYDFFSRVGDIEYVRQIADKGIGFVCFKKGVSIAKALKLNQQLLNGRPLRIMKVDPTKQGKRKNKKGNVVDKHHRGGKPMTADQKDKKEGDSKQKGQIKDFHGSIAQNKTGKKHKMKKGAGDKKKKLLAQKLNAAGANRNKQT